MHYGRQEPMALFTTQSNLIVRLRMLSRDEFKIFWEDIKSIDFLVLDEFTPNAAWKNELSQFILDLIDYRYVHSKTTIVTTKYLARELEERIQNGDTIRKSFTSDDPIIESILSRLAHGSLLFLRGEDQRRL